MKSKRVRRTTRKWMKETGQSLTTADRICSQFRDDLRRAAERYNGRKLRQLLEKIDEPGVLPKQYQKKIFLEGLNLFLEKASGLKRKGCREFVGGLPILIVKSRTLSIRQKLVFSFRLGRQTSGQGVKLDADKAKAALRKRRLTDRTKMRKKKGTRRKKK